MEVRRRIAALAVLLLMLPAGHALAAEEGMQLRHVEIDLGDRAALQRGAKYFVNYCLSCHAASYMRYNRMGADLGLTDEQVRDNLMFASDKVGSTMDVAMKPEDAKKWFKVAPPDLSVIARYRGADWLYNYLLSFYAVDDPQRPTGVDNLVFKGTAMPHVLWNLQGIQVPVYAKAEGGGEGEQVIDHLELEKQGLMNPAQYRRAVRDIVTYLVYMGEPAKMVRYGIGVWVLLFLAVLFVLSRALYKEYWKDVH